MGKRRALPRLPWADEFQKYRGGMYDKEFERRTGTVDAYRNPRLIAAVDARPEDAIPTGHRGRPRGAQFNAAVVRTVELVLELQDHPRTVDWIAVTLPLIYPGHWFERRQPGQSGSEWLKGCLSKVKGAYNNEMRRRRLSGLNITTPTANINTPTANINTRR